MSQNGRYCVARARTPKRYVKRIIINWRNPLRKRERERERERERD